MAAIQRHARRCQRRGPAGGNLHGRTGACLHARVCGPPAGCAPALACMPIAPPAVSCCALRSFPTRWVLAHTTQSPSPASHRAAPAAAPPFLPLWGACSGGGSGSPAPAPEGLVGTRCPAAAGSLSCTAGCRHGCACAGTGSRRATPCSVFVRVPCACMHYTSKVPTPMHSDAPVGRRVPGACSRPASTTEQRQSGLHACIRPRLTHPATGRPESSSQSMMPNANTSALGPSWPSSATSGAT